MANSYRAQVRKAVLTGALPLSYGSVELPVGFEPTTSRLVAGCVYAFLVRARGINPPLAVDRLRAHDQVAAGTAVHDVGLESLQPYLKVPRQALLDLEITHRGRKLQLLPSEIVRTAFKANVTHGLTSGFAVSRRLSAASNIKVFPLTADG